MAKVSATENIGDLIARLFDYYYSEPQKTFFIDLAKRKNLPLHDIVAAVVAANIFRDYLVFPKNSSSKIEEREALVIDRFRIDSRVFEGKFSVFLSYRRNDAGQLTNHIYDTLCKDYGETTIFLDINTMDLGLPFRQELSRIVSSCAVLVAVVGKDWLAIDRSTGRSRLMDRYDPIRLELLTAIENSVPIILVFTEDAPSLDANNIPDCLHFILNAEKIILEAGEDIDVFLETVSSQCQQYLDDSNGSPGLQLPVFPRDSLLSLQILTEAALGLSRIYKLAMDDPESAMARLVKEFTLLHEYEVIASRWSCYLGTEGYTGEGWQPPEFVLHLSEVLRASHEEVSDDDWLDMAQSFGSDEQLSSSKYSMMAAAACQLTGDNFHLIKRSFPVDDIVPKSTLSTEIFINQIFSNISSRVLVSCPASDGLSDSMRVMNHLTTALEGSLDIHVRGRTNPLAQKEFDKVGIYIIVVGPSFLDELSGNLLLAFSAEFNKIVELGVPVLPLMLPGALVPRQDELPVQLHKIFEFTVLNFQSEREFVDQMEGIISWIRIHCRPEAFISEACPPARIPLYGETQLRVLVRSVLTLRDALIACLKNESRAHEIIAANLELTELARSVIGVFAQHLGINVEGDTEFIESSD